MSHITTLKTKIKLEAALLAGRSVEEDPGWELLEEAMKAAAAELGGELTTNVRDYYGRRLRCDWGLATPDFGRGVGVKVSRTTGEVTFAYDSYGCDERAIQRICDTITQSYTTLAVAEALRSLNYQVDFEEEHHPVHGRKILVRGVL
ncbi:MAG: hypothetical protein AB1445_11220 [Bacillota bacterium]